MNAYEKIGRKIQMARENAQLSQGELASSLGCTQSSLSNYELGKRRLYLADLKRIADILGKPLTYFLDESEDRPSRQNDFGKILKEPLIREIVMEIRELRPSQKKSVLDYIRWQKSKGE